MIESVSESVRPLPFLGAPFAGLRGRATHDRSSYPDDRVHFYYSSSERGVISDAFQADSVF